MIGMEKGAKTNFENATRNYNNTSTETLDPRQAAALYGNVDRIVENGRYQPFSGPMVAEFTPDQLAAQDQARTAAGAGIGRDSLMQAAITAQGLQGYQPQQITGGSYDAFVPSSVGVRRGDVRDVGYSDVGAEDISRFMNPFESEAVQRSVQDIEQARQREQLGNQAFATKMGAMRGTGLFNLRDQTTERYADAIGDTTANMRNSGFWSAVGAAKGDAGRQMQADALNQAADWNVSSMNANLQQQAALDRAGREDAASQFGLGQRFNAQANNQQADLAGAGIRAGGANMMAGFGDTNRRYTAEDIGLLGGVGDAIGARDQAGMDAALDEHRYGNAANLDWQSTLNQALGIIPATGTTKTTGTDKTKTRGFGTSKGVGASLV